MNRRLRVLDAFCGGGGAGHGYHLAGFDVFGVDNDPARLEENPYPGHLGDAIAYILEYGWQFDLIHASPTCTGYCRGTAAIPDRFTRYDRLIPAVRAACVEAGVPYVIENVADARPELESPIMLCGRMFGLTATDTDGTLLTLDRHRLFETSIDLDLAQPHHTPHGWKSNRRDGIQVAGVYGGARRDKHEARHIRKGGYVPASLDVQRALLGTPWLSERGAWHAIPPAYTQYLGAQILEVLTARKASA